MGFWFCSWIYQWIWPQTPQYSFSQLFSITHSLSLLIFHSVNHKIIQPPFRSYSHLSLTHQINHSINLFLSYSLNIPVFLSYIKMISFKNLIDSRILIYNLIKRTIWFKGYLQNRWFRTRQIIAKNHYRSGCQGAALYYWRHTWIASYFKKTFWQPVSVKLLMLHFRKKRIFYEFKIGNFIII